jgi:hypothetical protein
LLGRILGRRSIVLAAQKLAALLEFIEVELVVGRVEKVIVPFALPVALFPEESESHGCDPAPFNLVDVNGRFPADGSEPFQLKS